MSLTSQYHQSNPCFDYDSNLEKIKRVFDFSASRLKIFDLGCGDGRLSSELVKLGHEVWGLDSNKDGLNQAERAGIKIIEADLESELLPVEENNFDLVLLLDVLEHLYDQEKVLTNIYQVLKPDGKLIISYPNHFDLRNRLNMLFGKGIVHWAHKKYNTPAWQYGHIRFLLFRELENLLKNHNFYVKTVQFNFMAGGIIPTRITLPFVRKILLKLFPNLLSGKFVIIADKHNGGEVKKIYLPKTIFGV